MGTVTIAVSVVPVIRVVTIRAVIPPRVAQLDPDSETEVVVTEVMMAAEVMMEAKAMVVAEVMVVAKAVVMAKAVMAAKVMRPRVTEAMEGVAAMTTAEVASMPTTEMPMSTDVPAAMSTMPATGEGDWPADHQHDDEDNRPENHPALHGKPPTKG